MSPAPLESDRALARLPCLGGAIYKEREREREAKYQHALDGGHTVTPLICEVWGGFAPEAIICLRRLAESRAGKLTGEAAWATCGFINELPRSAALARAAQGRRARDLARGNQWQRHVGRSGARGWLSGRGAMCSPALSLDP